MYTSSVAKEGLGQGGAGLISERDAAVVFA